MALEMWYKTKNGDNFEDPSQERSITFKLVFINFFNLQYLLSFLNIEKWEERLAIPDTHQGDVSPLL